MKIINTSQKVGKNYGNNYDKIKWERKMKLCSKCGLLPRRGTSAWCKVCNAAYQRKWQAEKKELVARKPSNRIKYKPLAMPKGTHLLNPKREVF